MRKELIFIIIAVLLLLPSTCYAQKIITYNDAKIMFMIDDEEWEEKSLSKKRTYIDRKWESDCGTITTGTYDLYGELDDTYDVPREYVNYKTLFKNYDFAEQMLEELPNNISIDEWDYVDHTIRYINYTGTMTQSGIEIDYDAYLTINNGYLFTIQYGRSDLVHKEKCSNTIKQIVASARSTVKVKDESDYNDYSFSFLDLLIAIIITFIAYEIYPFIRIIIMKKKYDIQTVKKMALWNSIIIGAIFLIINVLTNEKATWTAGPAFLYYFINRILWLKVSNKIGEKKQEEAISGLMCDNCGAIVKDTDEFCAKCGASFIEENPKKEEKQTKLKEIKNEKKEKKTKKEKYTFVCSNCGTKIKESDKKCPKCGESFEDSQEENSSNNMNKKYSDLQKLKQLLDDKIITKAEFDKEKKKILK